VAALVLFPPIPRPERFLVAFALRSARATLRAGTLERSGTELTNLAPRFPAERTNPSVPHLLKGLGDFVWYGFDRPNPIALKWPLSLGIKKCPEPCH
jgi:hypothetical protein